MELRFALAEFTQRLLELPVIGTGGFFGAIFTLYMLMRFFRWVASRRGGADYEDLSDQAQSYGRQLRTAPSRIRNATRRRP